MENPAQPGKVEKPKNAQPKAPDTAQQEHTPGIAIAAFVFALAGLLLDFILGIGILLSIVGIILSLVALSSISKKEVKKGKSLAIAGLILSIIGIITAIAIWYLIYYLATLAVGAVNNAIAMADMEDMTLDESLELCNKQDMMLGTICHSLLLYNFKNESLVISGEHCAGAKNAEVRSTCYIMHAQMFNTTLNCEKITYDADQSQMCMALGSGDASLCDNIKSISSRQDCKEFINQRTFMFESYQDKYASDYQQ